VFIIFAKTAKSV